MTVLLYGPKKKTKELTLSSMLMASCIAHQHMGSPLRFGWPEFSSWLTHAPFPILSPLFNKKKHLRLFPKYICLCSTGENKSCCFETTWGWVNDWINNLFKLLIGKMYKHMFNSIIETWKPVGYDRLKHTFILFISKCPISAGVFMSLFMSNHTKIYCHGNHSVQLKMRVMLFT